VTSTPGDLLAAVLRIPGEYWRSHSQESARLRGITAAIDPEDVDAALQGDILAFRERGY
jgi:hypothetical protein